MEPILAQLSDREAVEYAADLRRGILQSVSETGGHLASNLGAVELTVALHRVFDTSRDRLVFDVGHQCYPHKMITGRREQMSTLRQFGGISGFPKPQESDHDAFIAGHASTAVSAALGMARARTLLGEDYHVLALFGDGALTGGLAYEGLCDAGASGEKIIVMLNDNGMSISKNVGAIGSLLAKQRLKPQYLSFKKGYRRVMGAILLGKHIYRVTHRIKKRMKDMLLPTSMFEGMGFTYLGPVDGHDIHGLTKILNYAKDLEGPVFLHIRTVKGKGFLPAMERPYDFHGVGAFSPVSGEPRKKSSESFSDIFADTLCEMAEADPRVCAVTAAMEQGTRLECFHDKFPERFFDVGIAEGHAVTMAAGLAKQGMLPAFAVYSTFLQRSYDMLIHDVALLGLHVVIAVDRAGLVGEDGETHHGVFDVAFLDSVPGMTVFAPSDFHELRQMLRTAFYEIKGPVAIRYPRGGELAKLPTREKLPPTEIICKGDSLTIVSYGATAARLLRVCERVRHNGYTPELVKVNRLTPFEIQPILTSAKKTGRVLVVEEVVESGSIGQRVGFELAKAGISAAFETVNLGREFTTHGTLAKLQELRGLDEESLFQKALELCEGSAYERSTG